MKKYEWVVIVILKIVLFSLPVPFVALAIMYFRENVNGMMEELSVLTPAEWAAISFNFSALLLMGLNNGYVEPPDISPGEFVRLFRNLINTIRTRCHHKTEKRVHRHSEIL